MWELCETVCGFAKICGRVLCVHRSGSFHTRGTTTDASRVASERMVVPTLTRISETNDGMQIKTILNRIQKQRGFVYGTIQLEEQVGGLALTIAIAPHRRNHSAAAAGSGAAASTTGSRRAASSSSRSGACRCSFCTRCGGSIASGAA